MPSKRKAATPLTKSTKSQKQAAEQTPSVLATPAIVKVIERKHVRRNEKVLVSRGGPRPVPLEWVNLADVPQDLLDDYENGDMDPVEKIVESKSIRTKQYYLVKFKGLDAEGWVEANWSFITEELLTEYSTSFLEVHTVHDHRTNEETQSPEYLVSWRRPEGDRTKRSGIEKAADLKRQWVGTDRIPKEMLDQYLAEHSEVQIKYDEINARNEAVMGWLGLQQKHDVPDCCGSCRGRQLYSAVGNNDVEGVQKVLALMGAASMPSTIFEQAALQNNPSLIEILLKKWPSHTEAQAQSAKYPLSPDYIIRILGPAQDHQTALPSLALAALRTGQIQTSIFCFQKILESTATQPTLTTKNLLPKDGPFTRLHYQALTATSVMEITEECTTETVNAGSLGIYLTPLHCAAMNPHVEVYKMLVERGGDVTLDDTEGRFVTHYAAMMGGDAECTKVSPTLEYILSQEDPDSIKQNCILHGVAHSNNRYGYSNVAQAPLVSALKANQHGNIRALVKHVIGLTKAQVGDDSRSWSWPNDFMKNVVELKRSKVFKTVHNILPLKLAIHWETLLSTAVSNGDVATFLFILARNLPPNQVDYDDSAMDIDDEEVESTKATASGAEESVQYPLLESQIDTLLLTAITSESLPILRLLLGYDRDQISNIVDADIDVSVDVELRPYLRRAVEYGFVEAAKLLIDKGANPQLVDEFGCSLLMSATRRGHPSCVKVLVDAGVDVNAKRDELNTQTASTPEDLEALRNPFKGMVFCSTGILKWSASQISRIIENLGGRYVAAVSGNVTHCLCGRDGRTEWGQKTGKGSVKFKECMKRKVPFVDEKFVEDAQAKVPRVINSSNIEMEVIGTVLHDMMQHMDFKGDSLQTLRYLLDCGADVCALDEDDRTPLQYLVYYQDEKNGLPVMDMLLKAMEETKPEYINQKDIKDFTAIQIAVARNNWRFVERLLSAKEIDIYQAFPTIFEKHLVEAKGPKPSATITPPSSPSANNKTDTKVYELVPVQNARSGRTLLHLSALHALYRSVMEKLVDMYIADGKDINVRELWWDQAAPVHHLAKLSGDDLMEGLKILMKADGFNVNARDSKGRTILHILLAKNCYECLNLLERIAAIGLELDWTIADNEGEMAIHVAAAEENFGMLLRALLDKYPHHINTPTRKGLTPLAKALRKQNTAGAFYLLEKGVDMNVTVTEKVEPKRSSVDGDVDMDCDDPEHEETDTAVVKMMTAFAHCISNPALHGVMEWMMRHDNLDIQRSLLDAHETGRPDLAHRLFRKSGEEGVKAAAQIAGKLIHLMLISPSTVGAMDLIKELFELQPDGETRRKLVVEYSEEKMTKGMTLIQAALLRGHHKISEYLLSHLPSNDAIHLAVGTPSQTTKETILHILTKENSVAGVERYITALAGNIVPFINDLDRDGKTALHYAVTPNPEWGCRLQSSRIVEVLLKGGADPTIKDSEGVSVAFLVGGLVGDWWNELKTLMMESQPAKKTAIQSEMNLGQKARQARDLAKHKQFKAELADVKERIAERQQHLAKMEALRAERASKEVEEQMKCADELHVPNDRQFHDDDYKVYVGDGDIWDAQLTQVDLGYNIFGKNKFYNIQLLVNWRALDAHKNPQPAEDAAKVDKPRISARLARKQAREAAQQQIKNLDVLNKPLYQVFNRWGRMGGQTYGYGYGGYGYGHEHGGSKKESFDDLEDAKAAFCAKFTEKTRNNWEDRESFIRYQNLYTYFPRFYRKKADVEAEKTPEKRVPEKTKLEPSVASLMELITNEGEMYRDITAFGLDAGRLPAGQLSLNQIHEGYSLLQQLSATIHGISAAEGLRGTRIAEGKDTAKKLKQDLEDLCNAFYELIPFDFGLKRPEMIDTMQKVRAKFDMLDVMSDVAEAMDILKNPKDGDDKQPKVERVYNEIGCDIVPIAQGDSRYGMISEYIQRTSVGHATAQKVKNIFTVQRLEEIDKFSKYVNERNKFTEDDEGVRPNNLLLWHGSRVSNAVGIMSKGLKIAPPEAPQTGLMFGKGVYFADAFSKSFSYCHGHKSKLMFLCEVAVGESTSLTHSQYMESPISGTSSTKGMGSNTPDRAGMIVSPENVGVPMGKLTQEGRKVKQSCGLNYNEYIVYDTARIAIRYLVEFE